MQQFITQKKEEISALMQEIIDLDQEESHPSTRRNINDYNDYKINDYKKPSPPAVIRSYTNSIYCDLPDYRLRVDCDMTIGAGITSLEEPSCPPLDSWTVFKSNTSNVKVYKPEAGFFLVISQPPSDRVFKYYFDFSLDPKSDLEIDHIFCHSNQDVFQKISQIIWKDKKYDSVINVMGGFHILVVKLKTLYKKYISLGLQQWW